MDRRVNETPPSHTAWFGGTVLRNSGEACGVGHSRRASPQEIQLRKKDVDQNTGKFQRLTKSWEEKLVEAGVTDTLGQT